MVGNVFFVFSTAMQQATITRRDSFHFFLLKKHNTMKKLTSILCILIPIQTAHGFLSSPLKIASKSLSRQKFNHHTSKTTPVTHERQRLYSILRRSRSTSKTSHIRISSANDDSNEEVEQYNNLIERNGAFDLTTALFCGGLAFDAYAEPPPNSSRWERGVSSL